MKNKIVAFLALVLISIQSVAQITGIIEYEQKFAEDILHENKLGILYFGNQSSKYIYNISLDNEGSFDTESMIATSKFINERGDIVYNEIGKSNLMMAIYLDLNKASYIINDEKPIMKWDFTGKSKKIGAYNCQEAKTEFRGRKYTAYFTPEIPVNFGPWKFRGLPGLILEVYDNENNVSFFAKKIDLSPKKLKKINLSFDYNGAKMSLSEFDKEKEKGSVKFSGD